jgi:sarcosine oxidase subunit beta
LFIVKGVDMAVKKAAEVIIIGAGIIGTSIAYHLAKLGCRDVIVLEKEDDIGCGSTAKGAGGVRQEFNQEVNIKLSLESLEFFKRFEEETGYPPDFRQCGYLRFVSTGEELEELRQKVAFQRQFGVEVSLISPKEAKEIIPALNIDDVLGATYCPTDGKVGPYSVVQGYASAARSLGTKIYKGIEVISIKVTKGHQVQGVSTNEGEIEAPVVLNAAGPYAGLVGKTLGLDIPVHPHKKQNFFTAPTDEIRKDAPFAIDMHQGFGIWREGPGLTLSGTDSDQPEGFDTTVDWGFLPKLAERVLSRFPFVADVGIKRAEAGLHPDTPDQSPILGGVPEVEGLYLACGLNSQGIMHSPAIGRIMAEYILGIGCDPAISLLRLGRFKDGALQREGKRSGSYRDLEMENEES